MRSDMWLLNAQVKTSTKNSHSYWHLELWNEQAGAVWNTYVAPEHKNWRYWQDICNRWNTHPDQAQLIRVVVVPVPGRALTFNADQRPEYVTSWDLVDTLCVIQANLEAGT